MHGAHHGEHCAGGVDRIAAPLEHARPSHRARRFSGEGNPMPPMQHGPVCAGVRFGRVRRAGVEQEHAEGTMNERFHE